MDELLEAGSYAAAVDKYHEAAQEVHDIKLPNMGAAVGLSHGFNQSLDTKRRALFGEDYACLRLWLATS